MRLSIVDEGGYCSKLLRLNMSVEVRIEVISVSRPEEGRKAKISRTAVPLTPDTSFNVPCDQTLESKWVSYFVSTYASNLESMLMLLLAVVVAVRHSESE